MSNKKIGRDQTGALDLGNGVYVPIIVPKKRPPNPASSGSPKPTKHPVGSPDWVFNVIKDNRSR